MLMAVFIFCFVLAVYTVRQDLLLGGAPAAMGVKYGLALLMSASAFIGASSRMRRIERSARSSYEVEPTP